MPQDSQQMQQPTAFIITLDLANQIANYLADRPFKESAAMINSLSQMTPYVPPSPDQALIHPPGPVDGPNGPVIPGMENLEGVQDLGNVEGAPNGDGKKSKTPKKSRKNN